jgi:hypothetical protein
MVELDVLDPHTLLVGRDAGPAVSRLLERARGEADGAPPVLERLPGFTSNAATSAEVLIPHALDLPPDVGLGVLLARNVGLFARLGPTVEDLLPVELTLLGELPPGAEANLRAWIDSIGATDLGSLIGMNFAARTLSVAIQENAATITARFPLGTLHRALRVLFLAEMRELLELTEGTHPSVQPAENNGEHPHGTD